MKPITEQERQDLITVAKKRIKHYQAMKQSQDNATVRPRGGVDFDYQVSIDLMKVALASLTSEQHLLALLAEKVRRIRSDIDDFDGDKRGMWECLEEYEEKLLEEAAKYTAPPVPVIKFPSSLQDAFEEGNKIPTQTSRCGNGYCSHSFSNWDGRKFMDEFEGFIKGIKHIKRLNGLGE